MRGRVQVQPNDVCRFGLEVGIVGADVAFQAVRLQSMLGPDARNTHVGYAAEFGGQLARRPMCRSIPGFAIGRPPQHLRLDLLGDLEPLAPGMPGEEPSEPLGREALAPAVNVAVAAIKLGANLSPSQAIGQKQDKPSMPGNIRSSVLRRGLSLEFHAFALGQFHHALHKHDDTTESTVTVH